MVLAALGRNALFFSAVLPKQVFPPLFNRYDAGMTFGAHVDNAIRGYLNTPLQVRTDVSATLFISAPEDYDGGELVVEDTYGTHHGQAAGRRHDRLSGHQPAQRHADHARLAHRLVLLDAEPDPRRHPAHPAVRSRHGDPAAHHRSPGASRAWCRSPRSITTCCGNGRRCDRGAQHTMLPHWRAHMCPGGHAASVSHSPIILPPSRRRVVLAFPSLSPPVGVVESGLQYHYSGEAWQVRPPGFFPCKTPLMRVVGSCLQALQEALSQGARQTRADLE